MSRTFGFVIVGGGILGSALAAIAAGAGLDPLVLRRPDVSAPQADTLRNQGWLQSGIMYPIKHFSSEDAYRAFADRTFFAGRELLRMCGLPVPGAGGLLGVNSEFHLEQLNRKRQLLRLTDDDFAQLEKAEAQRLMGSHFQEESTYFRIPDGPFDEAAVLEHLRSEATANGAMFCEVDEPVRLERSSDSVKVHFEGREIVTSTAVVTAGAGSFSLLAQCGIALNGHLQRTPLFVGEAPEDMPAPIVVDLGAGFSAVRHSRGDTMPAAVVMGTRTKGQHEGVPERVVSMAEQVSFTRDVPDGFKPSLFNGRYTAGYEVIPERETGVSAYEPWLLEDGPLLFASPGRATVAGMAAQSVFESVMDRRRATRHARTSSVDLSDCSLWSREIAMHYMPCYSYNDAEVG